MPTFISALADDLVASGIGERYATSGISVQVNYRRDTGAPHVVLLRETGGSSHPWAAKENLGIQVVVDSTDIVSGQSISRDIYEQFHDRHAETISGHRMIYLRSTTGPPMALPLGPATNTPGRFTFSVNFDALIAK